MNTAQFLAAIDAKARRLILQSIADDYGISVHEAYAEVTGPDAEHLLEYLTGSARAATSLLMQKHVFRAHAEAWVSLKGE